MTTLFDRIKAAAETYSVDFNPEREGWCVIRTADRYYMDFGLNQNAAWTQAANLNARAVVDALVNSLVWVEDPIYGDRFVRTGFICRFVNGYVGSINERKYVKNTWGWFAFVPGRPPNIGEACSSRVEAQKIVETAFRVKLMGEIE